MRETLRLMSLTQVSYALSFVIFQGIFAAITGIVMGYFLFDNEAAFPNDTRVDSLQFVILMIAVYVAMIPFSMSLSTLFQDSKVANYVGSTVLSLPIIFFI